MVFGSRRTNVADALSKPRSGFSQRSRYIALAAQSPQAKKANSLNRHPQFAPSPERCPSCNGSDLDAFRVVARDIGKGTITLDLLACRVCDFAWQWPVYRSERSSRPYFEAAYENRDAAYFKSADRRRTAEIQLGFVQRILPAKGSLLDIGSGDGTFCRAAFEAGWNVTGLDPAGPECLEVGDGSQLRLSASPLQDLDEAVTFDVVTLWDVIEHVEHPLALIALAKQHIRPGGYIVVETGNYQSASRIQDGLNWWCYQTDHRWYFGPPIVSNLLEREGFEAVTICDRTLRPWWSGNGFKASLLGHLKKMVRHPARAASIAARYLELKRAERVWRDWLHLGIFTISARRP
jgi:SAM-dependent methyltransferase